MELFGIAFTWKWIAGALVAVFAAVRLHRLKRLADEIEDVFKAVEAGKKDGKWTPDEVKEVVVQVYEAMREAAPLFMWAYRRLKG